MQRLRIEKAATMLVQNPKKSITEIALDCGFSGSSAFAWAFREVFRMSASEWRAGGILKDSKNGKTESKDGKTDSKIRQDFNIEAC
ncbi:helix-turn-helix domain-containing protein [Chloroflexota bacterium]